MAIVLIEGWDHEAASGSNFAASVKGWTGADGNVTAGRFGGFGNSLARASAGKTPVKTLPSTYATLIMGSAIRMNGVLPAATQDMLLFRTGATNIAKLGMTTGGLLVVRNAGNTVIATGTTAIAANVWHYVEMKVFVNGASGTCEVHLDGLSEITSTVGNFGSVNIDTFAATSAATGSVTQIDDMYVADTTGSAPNNTFLGDSRVSTIVPNGAGSHTQWTANGAANNWDCVDEMPPDSDTTYVSDANPGDIDTYACQDIDGGATVYGVQVNLWADKDDAATRQIAPVIRQGGTDYVGTTVTMTATYVFYSQLYDQDPTAAAWTAASVNNDEFGVKEIA